MKRGITLLMLICFLVSLKAAGEMTVSAKSAILMDADTGRVLFEQNADERRAIASTTKIMTCLLALENCDLNENVTAGKNAAGVPGTSIYLSLGETLTMEEMLYGLMLRSGNDCAVAIAEHISGSAEAFARLMNERAAQLNADAYFTTPNGLDKDGNGASARGIALIAREALKNPDFLKIVSQTRKTIPWANNQYERVLTNKNKLLTTYEGAIGVKTGFTSKAGRCLVFAAERDGLRLVGAVLSCPGWFDEARRLLDYGFQNYRSETALEKGQVMYTVSAGGKSVNVVAAKSVCVPIGKGEEIRLEYEREKFDLPAVKGQCVGRAVVRAGGEILASCELVLEESLEKNSYSRAFSTVLAAWPLF